MTRLWAGDGAFARRRLGGATATAVAREWWGVAGRLGEGVWEARGEGERGEKKVQAAERPATTGARSVGSFSTIVAGESRGGGGDGGRGGGGTRVRHAKPAHTLWGAQRLSFPLRVFFFLAPASPPPPSATAGTGLSTPASPRIVVVATADGAGHLRRRGRCATPPASPAPPPLPPLPAGGAGRRRPAAQTGSRSFGGATPPRLAAPGGGATRRCRGHPPRRPRR